MFKWLKKPFTQTGLSRPPAKPSYGDNRFRTPPNPPPGVPSEADLRAQLEQYRWYHIIQVTPEIFTPGNPNLAKTHPSVLRQMDKLDLRHKRVLDAGCRDGLFSFESERRGASEVLAIDTTLSSGAVEVLIPFFNSRVQMRQWSLFDLKPAQHGLFDVILFLGLLCDLRYPFSALRCLSEVLQDGGRMIVQTAIFADKNKHPLLLCPTGDGRPSGKASVSFFNRRGLADTLETFGLRTDSIEWPKEKHRARSDGSIVNAAFLCTKDNALAARFPHHYWEGGARERWQKPGQE